MNPLGVLQEALLMSMCEYGLPAEQRWKVNKMSRSLREKVAVSLSKRDLCSKVGLNWVPTREGAAVALEIYRESDYHGGYTAKRRAAGSR